MRGLPEINKETKGMPSFDIFFIALRIFLFLGLKSSEVISPSPSAYGVSP